ncbi:transposase [Brachionus plicatilis]|uniref:Transposase n=1 Tax=Brachionus plicatilis TaxID=10195 RepID=A0A3M7PUC8_BRAPC|nr:transposase [Brachionus plicatilis]
MNNSSDKRMEINEIFESKDNLEVISWLQDRKLIPSELYCIKCSNPLKLQPRKDVVDSYGWRCSKCSTRRSIRTGTFFEAFNICLQSILKMIFFWSIQTRQIDQVDFLGISRNTIIKFQKLLRIVALKALNKSNFRLGGENKIVEIDESLFVKVKHFKGKDLRRRQIWVFGIYERITKRSLFIAVPKRDAYTLLNIIYEYILPDTIIYSDCWKTYMKIRDLDKRFQHRTVNHSLCFVNAEDGTHTNGIESVWCSGKTHIKSMRGVSRKYLSSYLDEFTWRRNMCETRSEAATVILNEIADQYSAKSEENELVDVFSKISTGDQQSDETFDVEDVDRNTTELPLYESGGEDEVEVAEIPCTSARKTTASDLVTVSSIPIKEHQVVTEVVESNKSGGQKRRGRPRKEDKKTIKVMRLTIVA